MAEGISIKGGNLTMKAPEGEEDRVCDLLVFANRGAIVTAWKLTPDELESVKRTGVVYVSFWGHGMPPTFVGDENSVRDVTAEGGILPRQEGA